MSQAAIGRLSLILGVGIAVVVIGWRHFASGSVDPRDKPWVTFTCCRSTDVDRAYHPGETIRIHWIANFQPHGSTGEAVPITLIARVVGSFPSAGQMKHNLNVRGAGIASGPIHVTEQSLGRNPISVIRLPRNISPGVYDLVTTITDGGGVVSGAASVKVVSR